MFELSALKKSVFDKLVKSMTTLQMQLEKSKEQEKPSRKRPHSLIEAVEAKARSNIYLSFDVLYSFSFNILFIDSKQWKKKFEELMRHLRLNQSILRHGNAECWRKQKQTNESRP